MKQGFHSSVHSALSGLSSAVRTVESMLGSPGPPGAASHDFSQAVATLERPLLRTVADVVNEIQVQLPEELQQKALQLQMLGSIFQCCDALVSDVHQKLVGALEHEFYDFPYFSLFFHSVGNVIIPTDFHNFHIFQRGRYTMVYHQPGKLRMDKLGVC